MELRRQQIAEKKAEEKTRQAEEEQKAKLEAEKKKREREEEASKKQPSKTTKTTKTTKKVSRNDFSSFQTLFGLIGSDLSPLRMLRRNGRRMVTVPLLNLSHRNHNLQSPPVSSKHNRSRSSRPMPLRKKQRLRRLRNPYLPPRQIPLNRKLPRRLSRKEHRI